MVGEGHFPTPPHPFDHQFDTISNHLTKKLITTDKFKISLVKLFNEYCPFVENKRKFRY